MSGLEALVEGKLSDLATKGDISEIKQLLLDQSEKLKYQEKMIKELKESVSLQDNKIIQITENIETPSTIIVPK